MIPGEIANMRADLVAAGTGGEPLGDLRNSKVCHGLMRERGHLLISRSVMREDLDTTTLEAIRCL